MEEMEDDFELRDNLGFMGSGYVFMTSWAVAFGWGICRGTAALYLRQSFSGVLVKMIPFNIGCFGVAFAQYRYYARR
jgi:hypothetical protein